MKQLKLNLPTDLKEWLEQQAKLNGSSQNSEVIRALRAAMSRAEQQTTI